VATKLRTVEVRETDPVVYLIRTCEAKFKHYFANNALRVLHNGIDLATCNKMSTLADLDINKNTELHVEAHTGDNNNKGITIYVKTLTGKTLTLLDVHSHW
jgi:hypothetical protein